MNFLKKFQQAQQDIEILANKIGDVKTKIETHSNQIAKDLRAGQYQPFVSMEQAGYLDVKQLDNQIIKQSAALLDEMQAENKSSFDHLSQVKEQIDATIQTLIQSQKIEANLGIQQGVPSLINLVDNADKVLDRVDVFIEQSQKSQLQMEQPFHVIASALKVIDAPIQQQNVADQTTTKRHRVDEVKISEMIPLKKKKRHTNKQESTQNHFYKASNKLAEAF